jgi:hypothetical protein
MKINFRQFAFPLFFTVIFFLLTLPVTSSAQWKLALPQFVLDGADGGSEGLGVKARKILKDEIQATGLFVVVQDSKYGDLVQKNRELKSSGKETFDAKMQAWQQADVEWLVKTNYEVNKEGFLNFTFRLYDINDNRFLIGKRYTTSKILLQKVIRRYTDELVFQITGKRGIAETLEKKVEEDEKTRESSDFSLVELSITKHINQFQSCGFNRNEIKVEKGNGQSNNIIAYVIYSSPRNIKCLISKKSKITRELDDKNLIFFQSLHDYTSFFKHRRSSSDNKKIYPLEEGLIKLDDRLIIFTAPSSKGGIVDITKVSSDSVLVRVSDLLNNENYLVSLPALKLKLDDINLNRVKINQKFNKGSKNPQSDPKLKLDSLDLNRADIVEKINKGGKKNRPDPKFKLGNVDLNRASINEKNNKINKKNRNYLTAQEEEFNIFKQDSEREIYDLRNKIKSLRNQLVHLKSDLIRSKQPKNLLSSTKKSSKLKSPESSKQKTNLDSLYKIAKRKNILQSDQLSQSIEINPEDIIISKLFNWVKAWESRNTTLYLSFYSNNFKDSKKSRSEWEAYRRKSIKKSANISIQVSNIKTYLTKKNIIRISFIQQFKSNTFSDIGLKELVWVKDANGWEIVKESWKPQ